MHRFRRGARYGPSLTAHHQADIAETLAHSSLAHSDELASEQEAQEGGLRAEGGSSY